MRGLPLVVSGLRLRHFVPGDTGRIMALNAEPTTSRWLPSHVYRTHAEAVEAVQYLAGCYLAPGDPRLGAYVLALELEATGELLGHVGFSPLEGEVEISYAVAEGARGRGHGAAAVAGACRWIAREFGVRSVVALTAQANAPSRRLLERAGFAHERDETRRFQGAEEKVSHYRWNAAGPG